MGEEDGLSPLEETEQAINELDPWVAEDDLLDQLVRASAQVRRVVPDCIGVSLTLRDQGITFTLVASDAQIAQLDAVQYLSGGPCVEALKSGTVIDFHTRQPLDWPAFANAASRRGVASTLSLPLHDDGRGAAGVNLYGASPGCFDGHHEELARIFGAWAQHAVVDADLAFTTRTAAREAPRILQEGTTIDLAVAMLSSTLEIGATRARGRLVDAARQAGVADVVVARLVTEIFGDTGNR